MYSFTYNNKLKNFSKTVGGKTCSHYSDARLAVLG